MTACETKTPQYKIKAFYPKFRFIGNLISFGDIPVMFQMGWPMEIFVDLI